MYSKSTLSHSDAASALELFEEGFTAKSVALTLNLAPNPVQMLYQRWQLRGAGALVTRDRRQYDFETKLEIVRRNVNGESGRALAEEYDLPSPTTVANWTVIYRRDGEDGLRPKKRGRPPVDRGDSPPKSELETLRTENERLRAEVAYLGKLRALRSQERRAKVQAVDDLKAQFPLVLLLQIAHLPKSTFYDHRNRLRRADRHAELKEAIRETFEDAKGAYGHRRILAILRRQGRRVSKKTVLTLMRTLGLQCLVRRRKRYNSFRGEVGEAAENVLNRQFATETAHTKWATDVTEFNIGSSKVYLSPILDLHDNRIISVTAGPSPSVKMVTDSLRMAIDTLNAGEKPLVHSDQGFQYRHTIWRDTLREAGLTQSMSRKGTCLDNAVMEGFFSHLKEEWFRIQKPGTLDEFHTGLTDYLRWWNTTRIQQRLGYLSPDEYRAQTPAIA